MPSPAPCAALVLAVLCLVSGASRAGDSSLRSCSSWPAWWPGASRPAPPGAAAVPGDVLPSPVLLVQELPPLLEAAATARRRGEVARAEALERQVIVSALVAYVGLRANTPLCNDITSPGEQVYRLGQHMPAVLRLLAERDGTARRALVGEALATEEALGLMQRGDPLICQTGLNANRYCPAETPRGQCPAGAFPMPEFSTSAFLRESRERARRLARSEVAALAEEPGR